MGGNRKIYQNVLLFNHHSLSMNITLDIALHKLFLKKYDQCFLFPTWSTCTSVEEYVLMLRNMRGYIVCLSFFFEFYKYGTNTELSRLKMGSRKYGRDTPLPASCPISIFSVNTKTGGINIEIRVGRDGIFSVRFHP